LTIDFELCFELIESIMVDPELVKKTRKACEKVTETTYVLANEPMLGCYRLQEHCHKTVPQMTHLRIDQRKLNQELQGTLYDIDYSINILKTIKSNTDKHFETIQDLVKNSLFLKQQLDHEEDVKRKSMGEGAQGSPASIGRRTFQRFSGSFDLPSSLLPGSSNRNRSGLTSSASTDFKAMSSVLNSITGNRDSSPGPRRGDSLKERRQSDVPAPKP